MQDTLSRSQLTVLIVALLAAVALASLLMLGAVARRTREFGTLKAIGWPGSRLVRQVVAESAIVGVIGGVAGVVVGLLASLVVGSLHGYGEPIIRHSMSHVDWLA